MSFHLKHLLSEGETQRWNIILEEEAETNSWAHHWPDDWLEKIGMSLSQFPFIRQGKFH